MTHTLRTTLAVLALAAANALAATARVEYVKPEEFSDAGRSYSHRERENTLTQLRQHLVDQAAKELPADQVLEITITDIDLAGSYDPRQRISNEVRIVTDIYPPKIDLRFRLVRADGSVVKEGERRLRDGGFLFGTSTRYQNDLFRYEKAMLDAWIDKEFLRP